MNQNWLDHIFDTEAMELITNPKITYSYTNLQKKREILYELL